MEGIYIDTEDVKPKDIISVKLSFVNKETGNETRSMSRPCLVSDTDSERIIFKTITSQIDTEISNRYGIKITMNERNGLNKNSAVLCTKDNEGIIMKQDVDKIKKIGEVSDKEMVMVLKRSIACKRQNIQTKFKVSQKGLSM